MDLKIKHDVNDASGKRIQKPAPSKASRSIPISGAKTKRKRKFLCNICQKKLSSPKNLETHVNKVHRIKDFICDYDGKHFNTKDKLRLHILQHRIYYRVQCGVCKKEYKTNQSMRKHLRSHFEHHQCETCGQTFKYKRLLENHVSALHQEYPTVPCKCKLNSMIFMVYPSTVSIFQIAQDFFRIKQQETLIKSLSIKINKSTQPSSNVRSVQWDSK